MTSVFRLAASSPSALMQLNIPHIYGNQSNCFGLHAQGVSLCWIRFDLCQKPSPWAQCFSEAGGMLGNHRQLDEQWVWMAQVLFYWLITHSSSSEKRSSLMTHYVVSSLIVKGLLWFWLSEIFSKMAGV